MKNAPRRARFAGDSTRYLATTRTISRHLFE
jgi:hypothetical protein